MYGFNIAAQYLNHDQFNRSYVTNLVRQVGGSHLVMDDLGLAVELSNFQNTTDILHRQYRGDDGDIIKRSAKSVAEARANWFASDSALHIWDEVVNEPIMDGDKLWQLCRWGADYGRYLADRGGRCSFGGFAIAHWGWSVIWPEVPEGEDPFAAKYDAKRQDSSNKLRAGKPVAPFDILLQAYGELAPDKRGALSIHEYDFFPAIHYHDPYILLHPEQFRAQEASLRLTREQVEANWRSAWLIRRSLWLIKRAEWLGLPPFWYFITEAIIDRMPNREAWVEDYQGSYAPKGKIQGVQVLLDGKYGKKHHGPESYRALYRDLWPNKAFEDALYDQVKLVDSWYDERCLGKHLFQASIDYRDDGTGWSNKGFNWLQYTQYHARMIADAKNVPTPPEVTPVPVKPVPALPAKGSPVWKKATLVSISQTKTQNIRNAPFTKTCA